MNGPARIAIVFETYQDFQILRRHLGRLAEWNVPYAMTVVSGLVTPERLSRWIAEREREGVEVFVVASGGSAALAGAVAARTDCPVIGIPLDTTHFRGQDALQAMLGLPDGVPVGVVGINRVENAFHWALRVVALRHGEYGLLLRRLRDGLVGKQVELLDNLRDQYPEYFGPKVAEPEERPIAKPVEAVREREPPEPQAAEEKEEAKGAAVDVGQGPAVEEKEDEQVRAPMRRGPARRIVVDPRQPAVEAIEEVADMLLEGRIVALPTDTVYGLAAVSTNRDAVRRLYEIKRRERDKPIPLLIHSTRGIAQLVRELPDAAQRLFDEHWPGALTLVFRKYPGSFSEVSSDETIGIRMPDHTVTLAVISMIARPLAVTSANLSGGRPALTADEVFQWFGDAIDCVLDAGPAPGEKVSTVLSLVERPFRILREGAVSHAELKEILGDNLAEV